MLSPTDPWSNLPLHSAPPEHTSPAGCPQPSLCNVSPLPLILLDMGAGQQLIPFLQCVPFLRLLCRQTHPSSSNTSLDITLPMLPYGSALHTLTRMWGTKEFTQCFTDMNQHTDVQGRSTAAAFAAQFVFTAMTLQVPKKSNRFCSSLDSTYMAMATAPCSPWQLEGIVRAGKH